MLKDVIAIAAAVMIITVAMTSAFWDVVLFAPEVDEAPTVVAPEAAPKPRPPAKETDVVNAIHGGNGATILVTPAVVTLPGSSVSP